MFNHDNRNTIHYLLIALVLFFLFELIFIQTSTFIWLVIWSVITYLAWQYYYRSDARALFWVGAVILCIIVLNTTIFKFILFAGIAILIFHWYQSKEMTTHHQPQFPSNNNDWKEEKTLFTNKWFGKQETDRNAYQWRDINIQSIIGETIIDLNQTVLPKGEPIIMVRQLAGTITIIVPFDVEVSIHHSVLAGSVDLLGHSDNQITNRTIHLETPDYPSSNQRVKIFTSMIAGKIEVKRG
ncbi:lia operon protein LiaF [Natronobacillus azotifigens]|uniref:Cell wall-active antibiotics response protein LiaF n=1 Tax=Natronobacillus azotifigens TaxID=472978 RepID=A0A9J6RA41_9BACI|nr:cell wall-active antibiotics response protein LiaF [Natronobacillus azotifigens]MCZ0702520.1 cell wall-active antibiotics response protein LiaF [Natronobacillus azotifigens]